MSTFRDFAAATLLPTFGNSNAPAPTGSEHTSQPATELAASDASELRIAVGDLAKDADAYFAHFGGDEECERCHGTKLVTLYGTYMGDADDQPCPDCAS